MKGTDMEFFGKVCQCDIFLITGIEAAAHGIHEAVLLRRQDRALACELERQQQERTEEMIDALLRMRTLPLGMAAHEL